MIHHHGTPGHDDASSDRRQGDDGSGLRDHPASGDARGQGEADGAAEGNDPSLTAGPSHTRQVGPPELDAHPDAQGARAPDGTGRSRG